MPSPGSTAREGERLVKVAVSALGQSLDDRVDERFGRAAFLLVVDRDTLVLECVDNTANRDAMQGSGLGAAESVALRGVTAVITGHLGPKAYRALQLAGIVGFNGTGMTVRQAVKALGDGRLEPLTEGEAHTGMA
jgi:predicted Fe-Mo cluster-binding NifX family protein